MLFQLKIIIPDVGWGRKINFCSFSSVNLNMELVTFSYTFHLLDTHLPLPYPHLIPESKNERKEGRKERERVRKEGRRRDSPRVKDSLNDL